MSMNRPMKLSLTVSIIVFLVIGFILPSSVIAIHIDDIDGIWTDGFEDRNTTKRLTNGTSQCIWEDGTILLARTSTGGRNYTFADGGSFLDNDHKAYYYQSALPINLLSFLFSPSRHTGAEHEFDEDFQYPNIEDFNETTNRYAESSSIGYKKYVVQHFRFKLDGNAESIGDLDIYWYGKADNARKIAMYYWTSSKIFLSWEPLDETDATGDVVLFNNLSKADLKQALSSDNYIDICVVATATKASSGCTLFTDYVKLRSTQQEGFKIGYGLVQTNFTVDLGTKKYWDLLTWDDYESGSSTVKYQILYNKAGSYVPIENSVLPGNEQGFTTPPISLSPLSSKYTSIKIQANLTTKNPSVSPKIYSWTVTWQAQNRWQDHFNSEYRIEEKNKVHFGNSTVNISLVSGDWPMFGQNTENTRASSGKAAYVKNLYWWSDYPELQNQTPSNPIIDGDSLYFTTIDQDNHGWLYKYNSTVVSSGNVGKLFTGDIRDFNQISNGKPLVGSPVIYDQYIVVATGELNSQNYVYAFNKDAPSNNATGKFDYSENNTQQPNICYWGSPVIADGILYITGWGGDNKLSGYHKNNMLIVLDVLNDGKLRFKWNYTFPPPSPSFLSPTWSFSTPAVSNGTVIVGCMNDRGDNLFAFEAENGGLLWNISVGAIGKAAPVVYNDTVFIVSEQKDFDGLMKKTKVTAVNINDGSIRWEAPLGRTLFTLSLDPTYCLAQATPAIANNVLYVTSPDGWVTALDLSKNGTELWSYQVYNKLFPSDPILTSSPAYADHILYVGTPNGFLYALNTSTNGSELWNRQTFPYDQAIPVVTDAIVTNGVVFFGGENGRFYVCGAYVKPNEQLNGSLTSVAIHLPEGYWWKKFNAIVQTNADPNINKITFSLLDEQKNLIKVLTTGTDISVQNKTLDRTLRLHADFWAKNSSVNPQLLFWNITFFEDTDAPFINLSTLTPNPEGWLNEVLPQFTVTVIDNNTGLLVSSAQYTVEYILQNQSHRSTFKAVCTGSNGTTQLQQITVNLSQLNFYHNITALRSLRINISDLAGNTVSKTVSFNQDIKKPTSHIIAQVTQRYNSTFIRINATANDTGTLNVDASGIKLVELYYRYSEIRNFSGDWILFADSTRSLPTWNFNFTNRPNQHGGYFELCTIATDNASNVEDFPSSGDISFLYDWKAPDLPSISGNTLWFKEQPTFSVIFEDDFLLDTIQYRPNSETSWTTIATDVNASTYGKSWSLKEEYWDQMEEDEVFYLYFKINDTLGNTLLVTSDSQAIIIRKDTSVPIGTIDIPTLETEMSWSSNFTVSGLVNDQDGSGIKEVSLYYRFSEDKSNWSSWTAYGDTLDSSPFEWDFIAAEGDGYYEFKINVIDVAGNEVESEVFPVVVTSFPTTLTLVMISLVIVLLFISTVIFIKWRKRK